MPSMSFPFALFATSFLLSLGGAVGCLCCILCGAAFKKPVLKSRLTVFCILLSVAIAVFAFSLILVPDLYTPPMEFFRTAGENWLFLGALFLCGILCASFWRSVLPFAVSCYIALSVFTGIKLYGTFGANEETVSLVVHADAVKVNGETYPVKNIADSSLVLKKYTLPPALLVPLPRVWFTVCGVGKADGNVRQVSDTAELSHFSGDSNTAVSFSGEGDNVFLGNVIRFYREWLLARTGYQLVPLEDSVVYPSLYTLKIEITGEKLIPALVRNL